MQETGNGELPSGEKKSIGSSNKHERVAWIATRKALPVAEAALGKHLFGSYLFHDMVYVKSSLPELLAASSVAIELPANVEGGYEQKILSFVDRVRSQCPRIYMIVQPSLRRRSNRSTWVSRWNQHSGFKPFLFRETCSCRVGDGVPGCHITFYIGTSSNFKLEPCDAVPTTDITVQSANDSLHGLLQFVFCSPVTSNLALKCRVGPALVGRSHVGDTKVVEATSDQEGDSLTFPIGGSTATRRLELEKTSLDDGSDQRSYPTDA